MASRSLFISLFFLFTFFFKILFADSNTTTSTSFSLNQNPSFISLYGDAKLINNGSTLKLSSSYTSGNVFYKTPIKIFGGTPKKLVSFSTYFSFYLSTGNLLAFVVSSSGYPFNLFDFNTSSKKFKVLSVGFEQHVEVDSSKFMSVKVMNFSSVNLVSNGSVKMQTWIDYEAGSKRLEVRLNRFGGKRPVDPVLVVQLDLWKMWPKSKEVFVGLSSVNGNSSKGCEVDLWRFKASQAPDWMHSQPLDPMVLNFTQGREVKVVPKENNCFVKILAALIVGIGFGALGTLAVMFMFTICSNSKRLPIVPEEFAVKSLQEYEHKKLKIVLDEASAIEK